MAVNKMTFSLEELVEEFQDLETPEERIQHLIELGQAMPEFPKEFCTEEFRVVGCQSMVWFVPRFDGKTFQFQAMSDAPMVNGLAAILVAAYSNKTPSEILALPIESIFGGLQLKTFLSPLRSNGLNSMIQTIRSYAQQKSEVASKDQPAETHDAGTGGIKSSIIDSFDRIRSDFPILSEQCESGGSYAYLDSAASSQRPKQVIDAMSEIYQCHYANVHRSGHSWASRTTEKLEASRETVRSYIDAESVDQVIFTTGTTSSINLVAQSWGRTNLRAGDEILLSEMEHHSNIVPWQQLAQETGAIIRWIPVTQKFTLDLEAYADLINDRTKLVSITAASNVLGTINPVDSIVRTAHAAGAKVLVDAAQAVPHGPLSVKSWGADWVAFSGHKMLASCGIGILYGKRDLLEEMPAWLGGGNMIKLVTKDGFTTAGIPHKFEAGTPPIVEIASFKPACEYLVDIGGDALKEHERLLRAHAVEGLKTIDGIEIYGVTGTEPSDAPTCGIVSFNLRKVHGETISSYLDSKGIAIRVGHHCAMPLHQRLGISASCRASFYLYNTLEDVDRFVDAVKNAEKLFKGTVS